MQKSMWLMAAFLFSMFISGCGGGGTTASVVASTTTSLTISDVSNKTLYSTSTKGYIAFQIFPGGTATWDSQVNRNSSPLADVSGTWAISNGQLVLSVAGTPSFQFTCIQRESNYLFMHDGSNNITRMYSDRANAETYLNSITVTTLNGITGVRLGGAIQGGTIQGGTIQGTPTPLPTFTNVSTVVGITGQFATPFADYTSTATAGRTPPVTLGRPIGITTIDGKTYFVLDSSSSRIHMVTLDSNGAAAKVKTLSSATIPSIDLIFNNPSDITNDGNNLYVTDTSNCTIDKIALTFDATGAATGTGTLTILAGSTGTSAAIDGTGNTQTIGTAVGVVGTARFLAPIGITTDGTNLYVTDDQAIRKIDIGSPSTAPQVTTLAGSPGLAGSADAVGTAARFSLPLRITTDGNNLYVTDSNNYTIRKVSIATGQVTTIAGKGTFGTNPTDANNNPIDANGNPIVLTGDNAFFNGPNGITTDGTNLYVTDWGPVIYGNPARGQVIFSISLNLILLL